jgi:hypothetical protein
MLQCSKFNFVTKMLQYFAKYEINVSQNLAKFCRRRNFVNHPSTKSLKRQKGIFNVTEVNYHFVNLTLNFATLKHHCNMFQ